jgi:hypothetical protein
MDFQIEFSNIALYTFLLLTIGLFFIFRLVNWLLPLLIFKKGKRKLAWRYMAIVELFVWTGFLIWSVNFLAHNNQLYAIGLFIILFIFTIWAAWIGLHDFIAGAIFKTNRNLNLNDTVEIGEYHGKIRKFTSNKLVLETESGEIVYLPYASLYGKTIVKSHPADTILNHTFRLEIPKDAKLQQTTDKLYNNIINLPWSSLKKEPQIKPLHETESGFMLEITVFSMERDYFPEIEKTIKKHFSLLSQDNAID